jgi:hypothetical protein
MRSWACLVVLGAVACDPVLDDRVAALGGETPGVHPGPLHRPGQPCLLCHDGALGDPSAFSVAGTVFQVPGSRRPAVSAEVYLTDVTGSNHVATTNAAGNFYVTPGEWTPSFPVQVVVKPAVGPDVFMLSLAEDGSCATCHSDPPGRDSPGHVSLTLDDGGVPR